MICDTCTTQLLCENMGCQRNLNEMLRDASSPKQAPLQLTEDMMVDEVKKIHSAEDEKRRTEGKLPVTESLRITRAFIGGWIIHLPDGKIAVASDPDMLGKFVTDWAVII